MTYMTDDQTQSRAIISEFFRTGAKDYTPQEFIAAVCDAATEAGADTMAAVSAPEQPATELAPTHSVAEAPTPLAWSSDDDDEAETVHDDFDEDAYGRESATFWLWLCVAVLAVVVIAAGALLWYVRGHHDEPAAVPPAPTAVVPSPDDRVLPPPSAAPAPAPPSPDDRYLAALDRAGISSAEGRDASISMGHAVCRALERGETMDQVISEVKQANPGLQATGAQIIADSAARFYCPQWER